MAGDAALIVSERELPDAIRRAIADRGRLRAAGLGRAAEFSWRATAEKTLDVYLEALT